MTFERAALFCVIAGIASTGSAEPPVLATLRATGSGESVVLPAGSEVWLRPRYTVSSKALRVGDRIEMIVTREVMVSGTPAIPYGTRGTAVVTQRSGKGAFGKAGKLEFNIAAIDVGGRSVPMTGHSRLAGDGNTGATVATGVAVGAVFAAFITGHSARLSNGTELLAYTDAPLTVAAARP